MSIDWIPLSDLRAASKRAQARRRYHQQLRIARDQRRAFIARVLAETAARGPLPRGLRARLARLLGVHKSVVTRDCQALLGEVRMGSKHGLPGAP